MENTKENVQKETIGIGAWIALVFLILVLSGAFRTAEGPCKLDAVLFEIDTAAKRCVCVQRVDIT